MIYFTETEMKIRREQLLHQEDFVRDKCKEFNRNLEGFNVNLTDTQIETLAAWMLSYTNFTVDNMKDWWHFPTKMSDWIELASQDNLPPKTTLAFKKWMWDNGFRL